MWNLRALIGTACGVWGLCFPALVLAQGGNDAKFMLPTLQEGMIGKVTFILGVAEVTLPDGTVKRLVKDAEFPAGSRIVVKPRAKLHVQLVDGGVEKLGSQDAATIFDYQEYRFDPAEPTKTVIRKVLHNGDLDTKTGLGGEAAKPFYRLNTPLAAIGILGTEYSVRVRQRQTWVALQSGEVVVAKLGSGCLDSSLGACAGGFRLSEHNRGFALLVRENAPAPLTVPVGAVPGGLPDTAGAKAPQAAGQSTAEDAGKTANTKTADKQTETVADGSAATSRAADAAPAKSSEGDGKKATDATVTASVPAAVSGTASNAVASNGAGGTAVKTSDTKVTESVGGATVTTTATPSSAAVSVAPGSGNTFIVTASNSSNANSGTESAVASSAVVSKQEVAASPTIVSPAVTSSTVAAGSVLLDASKPVLLPTSLTVASGVRTPTLTIASSNAPTGSVLESGAASTVVVSSNNGQSSSASTPVPNGAAKLAVEWGRFDPATPVVSGGTLAEQVNRNYQRVAGSELAGYALLRHQDAVGLPADVRDISLKLQSYEAFVRSQAGGERFPATISDAYLNISPARASFETGFNLSSTPYNGLVTANGVLAADGTFRDAGGPTRVQGVVANLDGTPSAALTFSHPIDGNLTAEGALGWTVRRQEVALTPLGVEP